MFCSVSPTNLLMRSLACLTSSGLSRRLRDVLRQRRLARAGRAVEAQRAVAARLQRLDDARHLEARLDVEHVQVVGRDAAARRRGRARDCPAPGRHCAAGARSGLLDRRRRPRWPVRAKRTAVRICAGVRPLRSVSLATKPSDTATPSSVLRTSAFARAGRRRLQFEVVGEAAPERRIDLLDAVGHPDRRHGVRSRGSG